MKFFIHSIALILLLTSCQNKIQQLITKKWDCVKVDNLDPVDTKFQTPEDSAKVAAMEAALKSLSWIFNKDGSYTTSSAGRTIVQGTYAINEKEKSLTCITSANNNINTYTINALTENDMILSSVVNRKEVIMHFLAGQ
jgi:hypothetical protein